MEKFTQKEKDCLEEYTNDLLKLMEDENTSFICDNRHSYGKGEIKILSEKVSRIQTVSKLK